MRLHQKFDVAIIGAGAAGLAAAKELASSGLRFAVIEARNRIGGRIWTHPNGIELGAEFIHGMPSTTQAMADQAGLTIYDVEDSHAFLRRGRWSSSEGFSKDIEKILGKLGRSARKECSFADFIGRSWFSQKAKSEAISFIEGFDAAKIDEISIRALAEDEVISNRVGGAQVYSILGGYSRLMHWLSQDLVESLNLFLNSVVQSIRWKKGQVEIETEEQSFIASSAIITLPVGVLKDEGAIRFSPELFAPGSEKRQALNALRSGPVTKIVLVFQERFWDKIEGLPPLGFIHSRELCFPTWWGSLPLRLPTLTGWAGGPASDRLSGLKRDVLLTHALSSLSRVFGVPQAKLRSLLRSWHTHSWQHDPYALGAYSYVVVGGLEDARKLATPEEETLYFAGEAIRSDALSGTVDGALSSGQRAAQDIISNYGRQQEREPKAA